MSTTDVILTLECSLLAVFILLMAGALVLNKWKQAAPHNIGRPNDSTNRNYIVLPHTSAEPVQVRRNVKQVNSDNLMNEESTNLPLLDDRTEAGRLYFSLKYNDNTSILTIKLIKGENLPLITKNDTKAFVSVQIISKKMDKTENKNTTISTSYQRTYKFPLSKDYFSSYAVRFEISRFDRFSKKYDVGYVVISLSELQSHGVDISQGARFVRDIHPWTSSKLNTRKRRRSDFSRLEERQVLHRVRKDSKVKQRRPQVLWRKLSHAVHAGLYQGLVRGRHESLQWDPFLIISQKYEYDREEYNECQEQKRPSRKRQHEFREDSRNIFPNVFTTESPVVSTSSQPSDSSPENAALKTSVNREFYRLVQSPQLSQSDSTEPVTSWSIPETFRFPPSPIRLQSSTVMFQSVPTACQRQDRLYKLTSLSSRDRKKILRKSWKRAMSRRSKLARMEPLHRLLYLRKDHTQRSIKRPRSGDKNSDSDN